MVCQSAYYNQIVIQKEAVKSDQCYQSITMPPNWYDYEILTSTYGNFASCGIFAVVILLYIRHNRKGKEVLDNFGKIPYISAKSTISI